MTRPQPLVRTSLPGMGGWRQGLQPLPAAGIYSDAAHRDAGEGVSFLIAIRNDPRVSFSLPVASEHHQGRGHLPLVVGFFQGWAAGRDSSILGDKPLSQMS